VTATQAARARIIGNLATAAVVATAIAFAWPVLYDTARTGDSSFIAACEALVIIGIALLSGWFVISARQNQLRLPFTTFSFFASIATILIVGDLRATTAGAMFVRSAPAALTALAVAWIITPERPLPEQPELESTVLYRLYAEDGELLYVGITRHPERRLRSHEASKSWWPEVAVREIRSYRTREDAARAEHAAIVRENPRYNVARMGIAAHVRMAVSQ